MDAAAIAKAARIARYDEDIVTISADIRDLKATRDKSSDLAATARYEKSIENLYSDRSVLIADRSRLEASPVISTPGKNPPLAVDASVPPLYANTPNPPLVVHPLVWRRPLFKPCFKSRFKPCVELETA